MATTPPIPDETLIQQRHERMTADEKERHAKAIKEGYKDEVCPREDCRTVLLAFHHFLRCNPNTCPMIGDNKKSLLTRLQEHIDGPGNDKAAEKPVGGTSVSPEEPPT